MLTCYIEERRAGMTYLIGLKGRTPRERRPLSSFRGRKRVIDFQERFHLSLYCGATCTCSPRCASRPLEDENRHFVGVLTATPRFISGFIDILMIMSIKKKNKGKINFVYIILS